MRKIIKTFINILCLFIPSKKIRQNIRNKTYKKINNYKLLKEINKLYPDRVVFLSLSKGIGEFTQGISLLKELNKKINKKFVIITSSKLEKDVISLMDNDILSCFYIENNTITLPTIDKLPENKFDNIYCLYLKNNDYKIIRTYIDYIKLYYNLDLDAKIDRIKPSRPENNNQDFLDIEKIFKNEKIIFIFPEANTFDCSIINKNTWLDIANKLKNQGYTCIFNSKEKFDGFKNIFFNIKETLYLANLTNSIITFRSGIAELLAISTTCKMFVIYPDVTKNFIINSDIKSIYSNEQFLNITSIEKNFDRENCIEYIYYFNDNDFYNFILTNI